MILSKFSCFATLQILSKMALCPIWTPSKVPKVTIVFLVVVKLFIELYIFKAILYLYKNKKDWRKPILFYVKIFKKNYSLIKRKVLENSPIDKLIKYIPVWKLFVLINKSFSEEIFFVEIFWPKVL